MNKRKYKRIIQIELNEIAYPIVETLMAKNKLPAFQQINTNWQFLNTTSETEYNNLEPWIQWVTAHTGKSFEEHQVFRLSDVHQLKHQQIWEELSTHNIESGIIGSMNTLRRNTKGGIFFSDPWSQTNDTYPASLRPLWELISRKVKGHAASKLTLKDIMAGMRACLAFKLPLSIYWKMAKQIIQQKVNPLTKWKLAAVFDLFQAELFKRTLKTTDFGYYTLFLNSVAHYQHHYWRNYDKQPFDPSINYENIGTNHDPITFGYETYDRILKDILKMVENDPETLVIIASGLSQVPYTEKEAAGGMNYYRLKNHQDFANKIGLQAQYEIYPLMSRDWQIKCADEAAKENARAILTRLTVDGESLFKVVENSDGYLFIETNFYKRTNVNSPILDANGKSIGHFHDLFLNTAIKSGHHSGIGNLWLSDAQFSLAKHGQNIPLTQLYPMTLRALGIQDKLSVKKKTIKSKQQMAI